MERFRIDTPKSNQPHAAQVCRWHPRGASARRFAQLSIQVFEFDKTEIKPKSGPDCFDSRGRPGPDFEPSASRLDLGPIAQI
jgi:hypothetical protein